MLGDRARIDARRASETNAPRTDQIGILAVHAGADRVTELPPVGYRQQLVSLQHGDDDVGFGKACREFLEGAHLEMGDARARAANRSAMR